ncbi:MAG: mevalonate kinase [Nitrososphaerales archaeon]
MKFFARAPGKIIITGEHFVVHGSLALAAAIDRGALVEAEAFERIEVVSRNLGLSTLGTKKSPRPLKPTLETIKVTREFVGERRGVRVVINSDLPVSSGLGSSSAVAVATVAATSSALGHKLSSEEIVDLAMASEKVVHGRPSGVDVNVAAYGGVILFRMGERPRQIKLNKNVEFIISYSGIERKTSRMVAKFSDMRQLYPNIFASLVLSSSRLTEIATDALVKSDLTTLGTIMNFFHTVLSRLGVSTRKLDDMVEGALEAGCLGAKLTGAGGGGCTIALSRYGEAKIIEEVLKKRGLDASVVRLPLGGVKVWKGESQ